MDKIKINKIWSRKTKKAQHEIVGFILIVVIVVVIGLFLLIFYLRQEPVRYESLKVQNFLQASMKYTTSCAARYETDYEENLQDLIKSCYQNQKCSNGEMACSVLEEILSEMLDKSWMVSSDTPTSFYSLIIYYEDSGTGESSLRKEEILKIEKGNCTGSKTGAEHLISYSPGSIIVSLEICYV